jgi:hypothetical protein
MSTPFVIRRPFAITAVNAYYEIKKEGKNEENEDQFKKNFVKFIVPYMNNTYFTEEIAEWLFMTITILNNENYCTTTQWKCENYYNWSPSEVEHLFLSVKNYHFLNGIKNVYFEPIKEIIDIMSEFDWVIEENDCCICNFHGYDIDWPIKEERGKFYYSIPGHINKPVCESCVKTNCLDIKVPNFDGSEVDHNEVDHNEVDILEDESEIYGTVAYLRKYDLIKCENCGNIWDGCAQCNCWQWVEYKESTNNEVFQETAPLRCDKCGNILGAIVECECWYYRNYLKDKNDDDPVPKNVTIRFPRPTKPLPFPKNVSIRFPRPTRPLPMPPILIADKKDEQIKELEEQNKILLEELTNLKQKIEELFNLTKKE